MSRQRKTVVSVVGARPQFIKLAPLAPVLDQRFRHRIIHSGQHYDYELSQAFFGQLRIPAPDIKLKVGSGSHGRQTGQILERSETALIKMKPDMVLVYGDTNTTLAAALAAAKLHLPVGHVEAGLRSFRVDMPEEINRTLTDHLSALLFYPTAAARDNLRREGITRGLTASGDLMYELLASVRPSLPEYAAVLNHFGLEKEKYILVTMHRVENADDPDRLRLFIDIARSIKEPILFLAHPRTIGNLRRHKLLGKLRAVPNLILGRPQPYFETLALAGHARAIMTDSGGLQKEACFLGRPCLTLRPETEWVETVTSGANTLVDLSPAKIHRALRRPPQRRARLSAAVGGRLPSRLITAAIERYLRR
ncbi:MAG: UDP-N-acetylglucosamine 2-epimerase (non-hydrolyzing) [candidate division Zixibacteria bacterium]|nr:UDP-N-acetylglucosamine 2-epimerase (non-hydrolyzing) [candidate division Zixibacteria bacterium]